MCTSTCICTCKYLFLYRFTCKMTYLYMNIVHIIHVYTCVAVVMYMYMYRCSPTSYAVGVLCVWEGWLIRIALCMDASLQCLHYVHLSVCLTWSVCWPRLMRCVVEVAPLIRVCQWKNTIHPSAGNFV